MQKVSTSHHEPQTFPRRRDPPRTRKGFHEAAALKTFPRRHDSANVSPSLLWHERGNLFVKGFHVAAIPEIRRERKGFIETFPRPCRGAPPAENVSPSACQGTARYAAATGKRNVSCTRTFLRIFPTWKRFPSRRRGNVPCFVHAESGEPRQGKVKG